MSRDGTILEISIWNFEALLCRAHNAKSMSADIAGKHNSGLDIGVFRMSTSTFDATLGYIFVFLRLS